jgi:hypothetical protein
MGLFFNDKSPPGGLGPTFTFLLLTVFLLEQSCEERVISFLFLIQSVTSFSEGGGRMGNDDER